jgi:hypothetical protein
MSDKVARDVLSDMRPSTSRQTVIFNARQWLRSNRQGSERNWERGYPPSNSRHVSFDPCYLDVFRAFDSFDQHCYHACVLFKPKVFDYLLNFLRGTLQ